MDILIFFLRGNLVVMLRDIPISFESDADYTLFVSRGIILKMFSENHPLQQFLRCFSGFVCGNALY